MAALNDLAAEIYTITNRPDLAAETLSAIKAATLKGHQSDFYQKDIVEVALEFQTAAYLQDFDYKAAIPRWRAAKYFRKFDPTTGDGMGFIKIITPEDILDGYGVNRVNVAYLAGVNYKIKSNDLLQYMLVGAYVNPDITDSGYNSWISDDHRYFIIYEACRLIFKMIGFDEQSSSYERLVGEQMQLLKTSQVPTVGE
jgi:hypothetical protein